MEDANKIINSGDTIKPGKCALCDSTMSKSMANYQDYIIYFTDRTNCRVGICKECIPKMNDNKSQQKVLDRLKITSYATWGLKEIKQ